MSLMFKAGIDTKTWELGMKKLKASTASWAKNTARTFAGQAAGMMAFESIARGVGEMFVGAEETLDAALTYDTTTDNIQKLAAAASKARMPMDRLMDAIKDLSVKQNDAVNGSKTWMETLSRYGFTMDDLKRNTPAEMFQQLAKAVSESQLPIRALQADMDDLMSDPGHEAFASMRRGLFNDLTSMPVTYSRQELEDMARTSAQVREVKNISKAQGARFVQASTKYGTAGLLYGGLMDAARFTGSMFGAGANRSAQEEAREQTDSNNLQTIADGVSKMSK